MDIMAKFLICVGNCFVNTINSVEKQLNLAGLSASRDEIKQFLEKNQDEINNEIRDAKRRYSSLKSRIKKNGGFEFKEFYEWYNEQEKSCYYCGTTEEVLKELFPKKDEDNQQNTDKTQNVKTHKIESKKPSFTGTLHIDRLNPNLGYEPNNCVFACALCNNAKSDMINAENFKKYFGEKMSEFLTASHNDKITNIH
ncbi:hypothetical protein HCN_1982 [Helicobacter cinaedi PAGU611]|uniref:hypothetical protein n=1 Tax=Helicobacter cinaedi TaxID=213 RepID=UPI00025D361E|nr:hypothetical protein [Helicobacter cinaedi]BAM13136.1 hypothetical protein HCN_1982 [Helicobacter cinaedi PAGU611]